MSATATLAAPPMSAAGTAPSPAASTFVPSPLPHDPVNRPAHYRGDGIEAIEVIEDWVADPGAHLGTALKYILRAGRKDGVPREQCLAKAAWYVARARERIRRGDVVAAWARTNYPRIDRDRVVIAFDLDEDMRLAIVGIHCALCGPTFVDHFLNVTAEALTRALVPICPASVPAPTRASGA